MALTSSSYIYLPISVSSIVDHFPAKKIQHSSWKHIQMTKVLNGHCAAQMKYGIFMSDSGLNPSVIPWANSLRSLWHISSWVRRQDGSLEWQIAKHPQKSSARLHGFTDKLEQHRRAQWDTSPVIHSYMVCTCDSCIHARLYFCEVPTVKTHWCNVQFCNSACLNFKFNFNLNTKYFSF